MDAFYFAVRCCHLASLEKRFTEASRNPFTGAGRTLVPDYVVAAAIRELIERETRVRGRGAYQVSM